MQTEKISVSSLNDTLEEQLRRMLVQATNECRVLQQEIEVLKKLVNDEQEQKYRAYVRIADLTSELGKLKS